MRPGCEGGEWRVGGLVPAWPGGQTYGFAELARRKGDFALAGAAVLLSLDGSGKIDRAAIALTGVDTGPVRLPDAEEMLMGQSPSDALFREAAAEAQNCKYPPERGYDRKTIESNCKIGRVN